MAFPQRVVRDYAPAWRMKSTRIHRLLENLMEVAANIHLSAGNIIQEILERVWFAVYPELGK